MRNKFIYQIMSSDLEVFLETSYFLDWEHPLVYEKALSYTKGLESPKAKAIAIYYGVRDGFRYDPYQVSTYKEDYIASNVFQKQSSHCIDKATAMIACCRAVGIPARHGFAKVQNHIGTDRLEEKLGTNVLVPHGYVEVLLNQKWVKATPAFNKGLCDKLNVQPLEFDGETDSLFQEYDKEGGAFMVYLEDFGTFPDLPLGYLLNMMRAHYPKWDLVDNPED